MFAAFERCRPVVESKIRNRIVERRDYGILRIECPVMRDWAPGHGRSKERIGKGAVK